VKRGDCNPKCYKNARSIKYGIIYVRLSVFDFYFSKKIREFIGVYIEYKKTGENRLEKNQQYKNPGENRIIKIRVKIRF